MDILKKKENQSFDLVVSLNQAAQQRDPEIAQMFGERFIDLRFQEEEPAKEILERLMEKVYEVVPDSRSHVMNHLLFIYNQHDMAAVLYEHTCVLLKGSGENLFQYLLERYEDILRALESVKLDTSGHMAEYFLFSRYSCQRNLNGLYYLKKWVYKYPVRGLIQNIHGIYQFDREFFRVEYLKAKVAEQNVMDRVFAKEYFGRCIKNSTIEVCKSYLYYHLARWYERGKQMDEALRSYKKAYKNNPASVKAVFKLAVCADIRNDTQSEKKYLKLLIDDWKQYKSNRNKMPLMDLEYAYKSNMLMDDITRVKMEDTVYYEEAQKILDFTRNLTKESDESYFIRRLYNDDVLKYIYKSIAGRMDISCLMQGNIWRNSHGTVQKQ